MHTVEHLLWGVGKHVAFGYLAYSLIEHGRGVSLTDKKVGILIFGVILPDIIDKSLVFVGILNYGRSFAHSLISTSIIIIAVYFLASQENRLELGYTFGLGYLLHIPVDLYGPFLTGNHPIDTAFLFWPVVVEYPIGITPPEMPVSRNAVFGVITIGAFALWIYDGTPVVSDMVRLLYARYAD